MTSDNENKNQFLRTARNRTVIFSVLAAALAALFFSSALPHLGGQLIASAQEGAAPPDNQTQEQSPEEMPSLTAQAVDMNASRVVVSGTAASPGDEAGPFQIVTVLPERMDGKIYSGTISFTASAPIYVIPGYGFDAQNNTLNHADYGELIRFPSEASFANVTSAAPELAHGPILPQYGPQPDSGIGKLPKTYTATVPFIGEVLELGNVNGTKFLVSYSVIADVYQTVRVSDIGPAVMNTTGQAPEENLVTMQQGAVEKTTDAFSPSPITVKRGENVTWTNNDFIAHTVTSGTPDQIGTSKAGQEFDSGFLGTKSSFTHTFNRPGEFKYFCEIHPYMVGKVNVQ